jgi:hypothetical protein
MAGERACSRHEAHVNKAPTCVVVLAAVEVAATLGHGRLRVGGQPDGRVWHAGERRVSAV